MLRRKNPEITFQPNHNHSPYRFQRKNPNVSPGLSPMRCRTPTRTNISPFRTTRNDDNFRAHSPIKFVSSKITNPVAKGFFRTETGANQHGQYNQKYAISNTNNDHSMKRQSFYQNSNGSKINAPYENSQRTMLHENAKLFSKLVEKMNSQKKKQPELVRRNTKPQILKPQQVSQPEYKISGVQKLARQKSQTQQSKIEPINGHIKAVQSVVYEEKQTRTYTYQHQMNTYETGKENKEHEHQHAYKFKQQFEKVHVVHQEIGKHNNLKFERVQDKYQIQPNVYQQKIQRPTTPTKTEEVHKEKSVRKQAQKQQTNKNNQYHTTPNKVTEVQKKVYNYEDPNGFDDLQMFLDKIKSVSKDVQNQMRQSVSNTSQASNVNSSILNMDPYL